MGESFLTVKEYQERAKTTDRKTDSLVFPILGLFGEVGSLLSEAKKRQRDAGIDIEYHDYIHEELGDILWYLNAIASRAKLSISDIARRIIEDRDRHLEESRCHPSFADLQGIANSESLHSAFASEKTLFSLANRVSCLMSAYETSIVKKEQCIVANHLREIFYTMIQISNEAGIKLDYVANCNLKKIFDRWPQEKSYPVFFDEEFPKHEKLPREMVVDIFEETMDKRSFVVQRYMDINVGDRLTDNALTKDDYRFHDVFHYAYTSVLGWSPVTRALFHMKRKSCSETDEVQDGARAILIEEGISTWIFNQAQRQSFFKNIRRGELSFDLLKNVRKFVRGYEAEKCPLWLWEEAILQGYDAFRFLKEYRRGRVRIDMQKHQLSIEKLPK